MTERDADNIVRDFAAQIMRFVRGAQGMTHDERAWFIERILPIVEAAMQHAASVQAEPTPDMQSTRWRPKAQAQDPALADHPDPERRDFTEHERAQSVEAAALSLLWRTLRQLNEVKQRVDFGPFWVLDDITAEIATFVEPKMPEKTRSEK